MIDLRRMVTLIAIAVLVALSAGCRDRAATITDDEVQNGAEEAAGPATERSVVVLCYHAVFDGATSLYDVPTEQFAEQLALLHERGYESVLPSQIADYLEGKTDLPENAVCLTFDDGPESILTVSKPLMDRYGYVGAAFLITDSVGAAGTLDWDQVRELEAAGWEIGSHSSTHERPTRLDAEAWMAELERSKRAIEEQIEGECASLAYPYGLYDAAVVELAGEAGYRVAFTIDRGPLDWTDDPLRLPRQMVVNGNALSTFGRWLDQEKLHLEQVTPAIGERVDEPSPAIRAVVAADGVPAGEIEISLDGVPVSHDSDPETREIRFSPELKVGANNLRMNYYGSPRREVSWVIVRESN